MKKRRINVTVPSKTRQNVLLAKKIESLSRISHGKNMIKLGEVF